MNPMIEALQKSRSDAPPAGIPGKEEPDAPGMDMEKCMMDMSAKMDKILTLLSGKAPADEAKENEPNGNGNGY